VSDKPKPKRERIDWHRIVFWSSLGVAMLFVTLASLTPDGKVPMIFEARGRHLLLMMVRDYVSPEAAAYLGLRNAITTPPVPTPVAVSGS